MALANCAVAIALSATLLAALAACGGGSSTADPSSPMPITTTPSHSSATTSPTATVDPNSDAAVIAGIRAWADALTAATNRADLSPLKAVATARCSCIQGEAQAISYLSAHGLRLTTRYTVSAAKLISRNADSALVSATVSSPAYQALRPDGSVYKSEAGDSSSSQYSMKLVGNRWLVDTVI